MISPAPDRLWVRASRLLALAIVMGVPLAQIVVYATDFYPRDLNSYLWAGEAWRTTGNPYTAAAVLIDDNPIYRYAPWFAVPWIWLSQLPQPFIEVAWAIAMTICSAAAVVPILRAWGVAAVPVAVFFFGWLVAIGLNGNVQPAIIALLAWGVGRRWGPVAIAIAASLKAVPILYVVVYAGRGEWRKVALTIALTIPLVAPMLLFDIPALNMAAGESYSLFGWSPIVWGLVAGACMIVAYLLARTRYAWLAAGVAVAMALPRAFIYDITFLLPGLDERVATRASTSPEPEPDGQAAPATSRAATQPMLRRARPEPFILALTAAWIIGLFSASTAPLQDLLRPLLIGVLLATVLAVLVALISGRGRWPSIALAGIWLALLGAWPLALGIALITAWRISVDVLRRRQGRATVREAGDQQVGRILTALGWAAMVVAIVSLATSGAARLGGGSADASPLPEVAEPPSMYVVLLDGYPAFETLDEDFGFDAVPFASALEDRGFEVAEESRSNYNRTLLTLSSMLHMEYVESVDGLSESRDGFAAQNRQLTAAINAAPVPEMLDEAGYRTVSISSPYGEATVTTVDQVIHTGAMTLFEEQLLRYTTAGKWIIERWPDLVADQHRHGVLGVLAELRKVPAQEEPPVFTMAHVFSPHTPFVFNADGSPRPLLECYPERCGITTPELDRLGIDAKAYGDGLLAQTEYLNDQLLRTVDAIVAEDPDAVIVLYSDHGARYEEGPSEEHFRTFLAARTPGHTGLLDDQVSLVNIYPILFNAYFGTDLAIRDYEAAWAPDYAPLEVAPVEAGDIR